jgi:hypothetical protein
MTEELKKRYDFSKGEQGKFYRPDVVLRLPIYLDDDLAIFIEEYARKKKSDMQTVVNDILRQNKETLRAIKA